MFPHKRPFAPQGSTDVGTHIRPNRHQQRVATERQFPCNAPIRCSAWHEARLQEHEMSKNGTLAVASLATAILMLDIAVVNTALGHIADDLNAGLSGLQWVVDAYTLALASVVLTAGSIADRLGRRRVFVTGIVVFTIASAACAPPGSIVALDVARAIQGLGGAIMFATSLSLLADAFPRPEERAKALAVYGAPIAALLVIGPRPGGALTPAFGGQDVCFVLVALGILSLIGTARW